MKPILRTISLCLLAVQVLAQSSDFEIREKTLPYFKSLVIDLPLNIEIDGSKTADGILVASPADIEKVSWEVKGETLIITAAKDAVFEGSLNLSLGGLDLEKIESASEAIVYMHHIQKNVLTLDLFRGSVKLEGKVNELNLMVEKARVYATDLQAKSARVNVWDQGSIMLHACETLEVEATNNGKVIFDGRPVLKKSATNGAQVISQEEQNANKFVEYIDLGV